MAQRWLRPPRRGVRRAQAMRSGAWWRATLPTMAAAGLPTDCGCRVRAPAGSLSYLAFLASPDVPVLLPIPGRKALKFPEESSGSRQQRQTGASVSGAKAVVGKLKPMIPELYANMRKGAVQQLCENAHRCGRGAAAAQSSPLASQIPCLTLAVSTRRHREAGEWAHPTWGAHPRRP